MFDSTETEELKSELVNLAGRFASAQCRFLLLLAEFDRRGGWAGDGIRSCGHWLSWRLGMSYRTSRDQLRVARALVGLPLVTEAFSAGRLSYAKVRAITRIITPSTERILLDLALAGTASHVERAVRAIRRAGTPAAASTAERAASWRWDEDGYLILRAKLPPDDGARLVAALEAQLSSELVGPGLPIPEQRQAEPTPADLTRPVSGSSAPGGTAAPGGSAEPLSDTRSGELAAGQEHAPGAAHDRLAARRADALLELLAPDNGQHEIVVLLDVTHDEATLDREGLPIARATAERLACDSRVRGLITKDGNPLYLGRSHRLATNTQLRALLIRDQHRCQFPGCEGKRFLHAHHVTHWLLGGRTDMDNLVLLCGFHHRLLHDQHYRGELRDGQFQLRRADGTEVTAQHRPQGLRAATTRTDLLVERHISKNAITPSWTGERLDLDALLAAVFSASAKETVG